MDPESPMRGLRVRVAPGIALASAWDRVRAVWGPYVLALAIAGILVGQRLLA